MNFYNIIVKLNLKKYKKSYLSLFIVIILACTFTLSITIFNDSLIKTEEQQRKDIYGSWHIAVYNSDNSLYKDLRNHGTIKSIGKMTVYGSVLGPDNIAAGAIGSADDNMYRMGLELLDGRFPAKDNEIAVEMSYLSMLGYSYELGQSIQLKIQSYDKEGKQVKEIEKTYILSGVLKNYSTIWKTEGNQLVSFFVTDTSLPVLPLFENVFGILDKRYMKNADELVMLTLNRGNFIKNDYTYYEYTSENKSGREAFLSELLLVLVVTITSVFFIFNMLFISLKEHNKSFVVMRCLGASKYQISVLYLKELIIVLLAAFAAGIVFGLLVAFSGYNLMCFYMEEKFIFYIDITKLILLISVIIGIVFLFAILSVVRIGKMPLTGNIKLQSENKLYFKRGRKLKPLTIRRMVRIFNSAHRKETVVYFLLIFGTFLVLVSSFYGSYEKYKYYISIKNIYTEDYEYGIMSSYYEPKTHMEESEVEKIRNIYGIDYVRAYRCSNYLPITWSGMEESEYAKYLKDNFFARYAGNASVNATVYGISDDERDYKFYLDEIDKGKVSADEFLKENEVILYLPTFYKTQDNRMISSVNSTYSIYDPDQKAISENTIRIGDEIKIRGDRGEITIKVGGIIDNFENLNSQSILVKPYSIICNNNLYDKLIDNNVRTFEYLQIYANKNANYERTDVEISKINDKSYIQNRRIKKEDAKYNALINTVISLMISLIIIIITILIQYNNFLTKVESDYRRNHVLFLLGMNKWRIIILYLYNVLKNNIIAIILGFLAIYLYQAIMDINDFSNLLKSDGILNFWSYIFNLYFATLPWNFIGIVTISYLALNLFIAFYPLSKYRKLGE